MCMEPINNWFLFKKTGTGTGLIFSQYASVWQHWLLTASISVCWLAQPGKWESWDSHPASRASESVHLMTRCYIQVMPKLSKWESALEGSQSPQVRYGDQLAYPHQRVSSRSTELLWNPWGHHSGGNSKRNGKNHKMFKPIGTALEFSWLKILFPWLNFDWVLFP